MVKKNRIRRVIALLLAVVMLVSVTAVFSSCGDKKSMGPTYMTIGGIDVPYDMVYCFVKQELAAYTEEELKDENIRAKARENIINNLIEKHYIVRVIAKELDLGLTEDARANINATMEAYRAFDDYDSMLNEMFATDAVTEELVTVSELDTVVYDFLCAFDERFDDNPDKILADIAESGKWYAAEYLVLEYDGVNHDARKADMEIVKNEVLGGKSLKEASSRIQQLYKTEYRYALDACFTESIYPEEMENAVKALEIGGVSEVIDTYNSDGYPSLILLRRVAISDDYVEKNFDTVKAYYLVRLYEEYRKEKMKDLEVVIADEYRNNDILDIK
ncbi:MAG: hypothetical protein IKM34_06420 [Clostridia bacterium]|nr:hypothetical protein [Clostridia bacterium]